MGGDYDAIVIGAGHNGLTTACYLARTGLKVLVLDQYHLIGGMTASEELTLPEFFSDLHASGYQLANFSPVPNELGLANFGLKVIQSEFSFAHAYPNGNAIAVKRGDIDFAAFNIAQYATEDAKAWKMLMQKYVDERQAIINSIFSPPVKLSEKIKHFEASASGMDAYRFSLQSLRSFANETFVAEETKTLFGAFATFLGASPDDACGAEFAWLFAAVLQMEGNNLVQGGMRHLPLALANYLQAKGGEVLLNTKVEKIIIEKNKVCALRLSGGEEIPAGKLVASSIDPAQLLLDLIGEPHVSNDLMRRVKQYEWGDSVFVMYVALNQKPEYHAGEYAGRAAHVHLSQPTLATLSRVYYECRSGLIPEAPLVVAWNDTVIDPTRAPEGKHLMKFVILNVPYHIKGDATGKIKAHDWSLVKEQYADFLIDWITREYIPNLKSSIIARVVHSPLDVEETITTARYGTLGQGALVPYQMGALRPIPELGHYKTPFATNLYLCGSSSHPGPGVAMAAGRNAFMVISEDLALS